MATENKITLMHQQWTVTGRMFGIDAGAENDSRFIGPMGITASFDNLLLDGKIQTENSLIKNFATFMDARKTFRARNNLQTSRNAETAFSLFARTHSNHVEIYLKPIEVFLQSICEFFPHAVLLFQGKIDICSARGNPSPALLSTDFEKSFSVKGISRRFEMLLTLLRQREHYSEWLDGSLPNDVLEPYGTTNIRLTLLVSLEWSEDYAVPVQVVGNDIVQRLFENDATKDFTIVVGNGAEVKCHSCILAVHSDALTAMVASQMKESKTRRVEMKDVSENGLNHLLRYLYGLKMSTSDLGCDVALELFQVAHKYGLDQLERVLHQVLMRNRPDWFTPDMLLEMYFFVKNLKVFEKLREHSLRIMTRIPDEVKACNRFLELESRDALELVWKLFHINK